MPREWVGNWELFRRRKLANLSLSQTQEYVWFDQDIPLAWLRMETQSGKAEFDWNAETVSDVLLDQLCERLSAYLDQENGTEIRIETGCPHMPQLARRTQARLVNRRYFYELHKDRIERSELLENIQQYERNYPGLFFRCPKSTDEILEEYIHLYNLVAADIPRADTQAEPYRSWPAEQLRVLNETNRQTGNEVYTGLLRSKRGHGGTY